MSIKPIEYRNGICRMIDQRLLPTQEVWLEYTDYQGVAEAIQTMVVRGAPAIGVAAAFGAAFDPQPGTPPSTPNQWGPRELGIVRWRLNPEPVNDDRTIRDAPFDSDLRNIFDPSP